MSNDSGASPQVHRREGYTLSSAQGSEAAEEFGAERDHGADSGSHSAGDVWRSV